MIILVTHESGLLLKNITILIFDIFSFNITVYLISGVVTVSLVEVAPVD